jgi:hypothetical protein
MKSNAIPYTRNLLLFGGTTFTIIVLLWPVLMMIAEPGGIVEEQLSSIVESSFAYRINFFLASLIAPALVVVMSTLALFVDTKKETPFLNIVGAFLLIPYLTLVSIAYASQYVLLPKLFEHPELAMNWFFASPYSIAYFLNQLGYTFFAFAACAIGWKFLFESGLSKWIGVLLWASGSLSIVAFIGLAIQNEFLNLATFPSGMLTIPFGMLVALKGWRMRKAVF